MSCRWPCLALLAALLLTGCGGPVGPIHGGRLSGPVARLPADLSAFEAAQTVQLETDPASPYSVNTWIDVLDGRIYLASSLIHGTDEPSQRRWVQNVMRDPRVRLRVDGTVYELRAVRVEDIGEREAARAALLAKYGEKDDAHARSAWIYRLVRR